MTIAYWSVLAAILLPFPFSWIAKFSQPGFDNAKPREFLAGLDGVGARANWAQINTFEALPGFIGAVIIAHLTGANQYWVDWLAFNFVALRLAYGYFYIVDLNVLRSLSWAAAMACVVALFVISV